MTAQPRLVRGIRHVALAVGWILSAVIILAVIDTRILSHYTIVRARTPFGSFGGVVSPHAFVASHIDLNSAAFRSRQQNGAPDHEWTRKPLSDQVAFPTETWRVIWRQNGASIIAVPHWLGVLIAAGFVSWRIAIARRLRRRRAASTQCFACGYDIRASAEVCPECGTAR